MAPDSCDDAAQRSQTTTWVSRGATSRAGSMSPTGTSRIRSSRSPMPASSSPPVAVSAEMCDVGHQAAEQHAEQRQQALHDQHRHGREHHPDPEARGERHRGEPVEHRLQRQLVDAAPQAVVERAEDRQRADAEQQGCREPPLDEAFPRGVVGATLGGRAARHPGLDPAGQPLEPVLDAQRRPGDRADEQRPEHDEQREAGADGVTQGGVGHGDRRQPGDQQGDQAEHVGDDRAGVLAQTVTDQHPQTGARRAL